MNFRWIGISNEGNNVKLNKFNGTFNFSASLTPTKLKKGVVISTEILRTPKQDHILEIALRPFRYDSDKRELFDYQEKYTSFSDPGVPLTNKITKITGIKIEDISDKKINWDRIRQFLDEADLAIAYNAASERPLIDDQIQYSDTVWSCVVRQVDWFSKGFSTTNFDLLKIYHGFFCNPHSASENVDALLHLLSFKDPNNNELSYFNELLINSHTPYKIVSIFNFPYRFKSEIKKFKFHWDAVNKSWYRLIPTPLYNENEIKRIIEICNSRGAKLNVSSIPLSDNFSQKPFPY